MITALKRRILFDFIRSIQMSGTGSIMAVSAPALYNLADEYLRHGHIAPAWTHPRHALDGGVIDEYLGQIRDANGNLIGDMDLI